MGATASKRIVNRGTHPHTHLHHFIISSYTKTKLSIQLPPQLPLTLFIQSFLIQLLSLYTNNVHFILNSQSLFLVPINIQSFLLPQIIITVLNSNYL